MVILTDLSEVLIHGVQDTAWRISEKTDVPAGAFYNSRMMDTEFEFQLLLRGLISENEYINTLLGDGECPFTAFDVKTAFSKEFAVSVPGTLDVYQRISAFPETIGSETIIDGSPEIIIVSDHIDERIDEVMSLHPEVFAITSDQIWSCDIGMIKRDEGFFTKLLDLLNLEPEEVVFVDDSVTNVNSAKSAGITSILFENASQLETELTKLGFEFLA